MTIFVANADIRFSTIGLGAAKDARQRHCLTRLRLRHRRRRKCRRLRHHALLHPGLDQARAARLSRSRRLAADYHSIARCPGD